MKTELKTAGRRARRERVRARQINRDLRIPIKPQRPFDAVAYAAVLEVIG